MRKASRFVVRRGLVLWVGIGLTLLGAWALEARAGYCGIPPLPPLGCTYVCKCSPTTMECWYELVCNPIPGGRR